MTGNVAPELFDILKCPQCKGRLREIEGVDKVECTDCKTKYPVENGILVILPPKR